MEIIFFDLIYIYIFKKCLFGLRFDSSRFPISFIARFGLFYQADFWCNSELSYDKIHRKYNKITNLLIPFICDIEVYRELNI